MARYGNRDGPELDEMFLRGYELPLGSLSGFTQDRGLHPERCGTSRIDPGIILESGATHGPPQTTVRGGRNTLDIVRKISLLRGDLETERGSDTNFKPKNTNL